MPQHTTLYDDLTVKENLDFVASLYGLFLFARRRRIRALLEWLDLSEASGRRAGKLSGGMRRRLQLACALVHDPDLVFLDEPTAGIDPLVRQAIWQELHRLRDAGRTLVITTQYVPEAEECDTVALIADGRLVAFAHRRRSGARRSAGSSWRSRPRRRSTSIGSWRARASTRSGASPPGACGS